RGPLGRGGRRRAGARTGPERRVFSAATIAGSSGVKGATVQVRQGPRPVGGEARRGRPRRKGGRNFSAGRGLRGVGEDEAAGRGKTRRRLERGRYQCPRPGC